MRNAVQTRTRILDAAEVLILERGFGATTVDAVIDRAGVTKGAFFHHFGSKAELARSVVERYAERDAEQSAAMLARAERLSRDPLQQVLILVGLWQEWLESLTEPFPGCLFASYCYQAELFDEHTLEVVRETFLRWREEVGGKLAQAIDRHPPLLPTDAESLADQLSAVMEGAFVLSRTLEDPQLVSRQLMHFRSYLELLFGVEAGESAA